MVHILGFIIALAMLVGGVVVIRKRPSKSKVAGSTSAATAAPGGNHGKSGIRGAIFGNDDSNSYNSAAPDAQRPKYSKSADLGMFYGGILLSAIGFIIAVSMCFTTVSAKNVGVVVSFGAVDQNTRHSGLNFKAPWAEIVSIDGTIQTDEYNAQYTIPVRIGDGSVAHATITNRWSINAESGAKIYENYRSNDPTQTFRSAVVSTQLEAAVQKALKDYNPIAELKKVEGTNTGQTVSFSPDYDAVSKDMTEDMQARLKATGGLANIESVTFSNLKLAPNTQKKLDNYIAAIGETRIAMQKEETAKAQANANKTLSDSVSNDPNVLVSKCFDSVADAISSNYKLPAGFSCWSGNNSVVIPATK